MAFCSNCGAQLEDGANVCPNCGAPVAGANPNANANPDVNPVGGNTSADANDVNTNKIYAVLAYFGFLVLIPILAAPKSEFAKYHSNQGLVLFIFEIICMALGIVPILGWLVSFAGGIFALVLAILGIVNAVNGEMKELPVIGSIKILK